jgi:hypothetical protein
MRSETNLLKEQIKCASSLTEKIELLRNAYNCDECYIISAGPSFKEIDPQVLREKLKDKLVIAVKQTYNLLKEITDFHLLNPYNYQPYEYISNEPIICYTEIEGLDYKLPLLKSDLKFTIPLSECSKEKSLSVLRNFDDYLIENAHQRPFGPGIMHELGIYLPVLLGIKRVYVIGWDLGSAKSNIIERFYNKRNTNFITSYLIDNKPNVYNKYLVPILNKYNYFLFLLGYNRVLNNPGVAKNEASFIADSTWDLYKWYQEKNIDLFVISNISLLDKRIPRIQI